MDMKLEIHNLACGYGSRRVLSGISLGLGAGDILSLLGPNGVGKTTLFKTLLGFLPSLEGEILLNERAMNHWSAPERARLMGYVPQAHTPPFPYRVLDVVVMGRSAHLGLFSAPSARDYALAEAALEELAIGRLAGRIYTELSGGEQQMVLIARALTQQPQLLILDEPTASLDFGNQTRVLQQIIRLSRRGLGIIMTTHDPNHAFLCDAQVPCSQVALLQPDGELLCGDAEAVVTEVNLHRAYGVGVHITRERGEQHRDLRHCIPLMEGAV